MALPDTFYEGILDEDIVAVFASDQDTNLTQEENEMSSWHELFGLAT